MEHCYKINSQWNGEPITHEPVIIELSHSASTDNHVQMTVKSPFFNDPPNPGGEKGKPFPNLWDYEVVEAFFLNNDNKYLEVELCPHGQHIVLLLDGVRQIKHQQLDMEFTASIEGNGWEGTAVIPCEYFPPAVTKFNAYAIHGSGEDRQYEALYPAPAGKYTEPDFHRLDYFKNIDVTHILPGNSDKDKYQSPWWKQ